MKKTILATILLLASLLIPVLQTQAASAQDPQEFQPVWQEHKPLPIEQPVEKSYTSPPFSLISRAVFDPLVFTPLVVKSGIDASNLMADALLESKGLGYLTPAVDLISYSAKMCIPEPQLTTSYTDRWAITIELQNKDSITRRTYFQDMVEPASFIRIPANPMVEMTQLNRQYNPAIEIVPPSIQHSLTNQRSFHTNISYSSGVTVNPYMVNHPTQILKRTTSGYTYASDLTLSSSLMSGYTSPPSLLGHSPIAGISSPSVMLKEFNQNNGYHSYLEKVSSNRLTQSLFSPSSYSSYQTSWSSSLGSSSYSSSITPVIASPSSLVGLDSILKSFSPSNSLISGYTSSSSVSHLSPISGTSLDYKPSYLNPISSSSSLNPGNSDILASSSYPDILGNSISSNSLISGYASPSSLSGHTSILGQSSSSLISGYTNPSSWSGSSNPTYPSTSGFSNHYSPGISTSSSSFGLSLPSSFSSFGLP